MIIYPDIYRYINTYIQIYISTLDGLCQYMSVLNPTKCLPSLLEASHRSFASLRRWRSDYGATHRADRGSMLPCPVIPPGPSGRNQIAGTIQQLWAWERLAMVFLNIQIPWWNFNGISKKWWSQFHRNVFRITTCLALMTGSLEVVQIEIAWCFHEISSPWAQSRAPWMCHVCMRVCNVHTYRIILVYIYICIYIYICTIVHSHQFRSGQGVMSRVSIYIYIISTQSSI